VTEAWVLLAIPARGGSKRLPRKNLAELGGKPLLAHTIEAARDSKLAGEVFVCTEDDEIAQAAARYGAQVFRIPEALAGDAVSSTVPCLALYESLRRQGANIDYLCNLQPTSPLRTGQDIRNAFETLTRAGSDFLVSVTPVDPHYFHWAVVEEQQGWGMFFGDKFMKERTELPPAFRPNGAIKLGRASRVKEFGHFFGRPLTVHPMPEERSIHVATSFDLSCARAVLQGGGSRQGRASATLVMSSLDGRNPKAEDFYLEGTLSSLMTFTNRHLHDAAYLAWLRDYEVVKTLNRPEYLTPIPFEPVREYCEALMRSPRDIYLAIHHGLDRRFIGTVRAARIDPEARTADIGILVGDKSYWGRGIATDSVRTLARYLFDALGLRKVTAGLMSTNPAMLRVFTKLGFQEEGRFRQQDCFEGRYVDHLHLGCFRNELA